MAVAGLSIRLFLDHHMDPRLATDLRRVGFAVTYPRELGTERATDETHLRWAAEQGWVICSFDVGDFQRLAEQWAEQGRHHAGIILAQAPPRLTYRPLRRRLLAFLDAVSAEEMVDQLHWLDASWDRSV